MSNIDLSKLNSLSPTVKLQNSSVSDADSATPRNSLTPRRNNTINKRKVFKKKVPKIKRLTYLNEFGEKAIYDIKIEEYNVLCYGLGPDFDLQSLTQTSIIVKNLLQGLPSKWQQESDIYGEIVFYNKSTHETSYEHPLFMHLRSALHVMQQHRKEVDQLQLDGDIILPDCTQKQLDFQQRQQEIRRLNKKESGQITGRGGQKIIMGSSTAIKLLKSKMESGIKPLDVISSLTFKDTKSEMRLKQLLENAKTYKAKEIYQQCYKGNELFNETLMEAFAYYEKQFTKILSNSQELIGEDNLMPKLPDYIKNNDYFKSITMEQQINLAFYYGINPSSEYYLLWIPQVALSLKLPYYWQIGFGIQHNDEEHVYENRAFYRHIVKQTIIHFHPADAYIRYLVETQKQSKHVTSHAHFKNFEFRVEDPLNREYEAKQQFCELLGIENIIKHSIFVKLNQDQQALAKVKNIQWLGQQEALRAGEPDMKQQFAMQEAYDKFTDAEIFAIAQQCGLDMEKDLHLINYLVMISGQVKAKHDSVLEFRYIMENNTQNVDGRGGGKVTQPQLEQNYYWRDTVLNINHKVFPLLNEIKQRLDVLKQNLSVFTSTQQYQSCLSDMQKIKEIFKGDPSKLKAQINEQRHNLVQQYLTSMLDKGKIDPAKFKLHQHTRVNTKLFVMPEDIERIFHLLGNKVKHQDIIDFCFQSPFKFNEDITSQRLLAQLSSEDSKFEYDFKKYKFQDNFEEYEANDGADQDKSQEKRNLHRMHIRNLNMLKTQESSNFTTQTEERRLQLLKERISDVRLDEVESDDDDFVKQIMMRKGQGGMANLDDINDKYGAAKRLIINQQSNKNISDYAEDSEKGVLSETLAVDGEQTSSAKKRSKSKKKSTYSKSRFKKQILKPLAAPLIKLDKSPSLPVQEQAPTVPVQQQQNVAIVSGMRGQVRKQKAKNQLYDIPEKKDIKKSANSQRLNNEDLNILTDKAGNLLPPPDEIDAMFTSTKRKKKHQPSNDQNQPQNIDKPKLPDRAQILKSKLDEVLSDLAKMTHGISNLIKMPTGSNALVNKLAEIIYTTDIDVDEFLLGLEYQDSKSDEDLLKKLINNIQEVHEKQQLKEKKKSNETEEEASNMAECYFNILVAKRNKAKASHQEDINKQVDNFLEKQRKLSIYDRLVKALFRMTKKRVVSYDQSDQLTFQSKINAQAEPEFSNFVYIRGDVKRENQEDHEHKTQHLNQLHSLQGQLEGLSHDLLIKEVKQQQMMGFSLNRQSKLLSDTHLHTLQNNGTNMPYKKRQKKKKKMAKLGAELKKYDSEVSDEDEGYFFDTIKVQSQHSEVQIQEKAREQDVEKVVEQKKTENVDVDDNNNYISIIQTVEEITGDIILNNNLKAESNIVNAQQNNLIIKRYREAYLTKVKFFGRRLSQDTPRDIRAQTQRFLLSQKSLINSKANKKKEEINNEDTTAQETDENTLIYIIEQQQRDPNLGAQYLKTSKYLNQQRLSADLRPEQVVKAGLEMGLKLYKSDIKEPFGLLETDLLWIPYLMLLVDTPYQDIQTLNPTFTIKSHPAFAYMHLLLASQRLSRLQKLSPLSYNAQSLLIKDCSWLCFKDQNNREHINNGIYYYNMSTRENKTIMPDSIMQAVKDTGAQLIPDKDSYLKAVDTTMLKAFASTNHSEQDIDRLETTLQSVLYLKKPFHSRKSSLPTLLTTHNTSTANCTQQSWLNMKQTSVMSTPRLVSNNVSRRNVWGQSDRLLR